MVLSERIERLDMVVKGLDANIEAIDSHVKHRFENRQIQISGVGLHRPFSV